VPRSTTPRTEEATLSVRNEPKKQGKTLAKKMEGKIALVAGGSAGIGAGIAKRLAADGAEVAITYTKGADAAASVIEEIERAGGKAIAIQADATNADAVRSAVKKTVAIFGRIDVLVNNAGTVDEIAGLMAFVGNAEAAYITSGNLTLDGGPNA
jgi:3-oxoacyl-[acyl-carrier protein] reductase